MVFRRDTQIQLALQAASLHAVYLTLNILRHSSLANRLEPIRASFTMAGGSMAKLSFQLGELEPFGVVSVCVCITKIDYSKILRETSSHKIHVSSSC